MKRHFLVNPVAGRGKLAVETIEKIKELCANDEDSSVYITKNSSDAEKYCNEISSLPGEHHFIICGGDGTLCEALNGLAGKKNSRLSVIPIGTGNDFVRNFCTKEGDSELFFDLEAQVKGRSVLLDYLEVKINDLTKKLSLNMLNSGFDSEVADRVNQLRSNKMIPPKVAYLAAVAQKFVSKPTVKAEIDIDGELLEMDERTLIAIGNGAYCGGGFKAAAKASLDDGLADICVVRNTKRLNFVKLIGYYKKGTHLEVEKLKNLFTYRQCKNIKIKFEKTQKVAFDGETELCDSLEINVVNKGVALCLPEGIDTDRFEKACFGTECEAALV